MARTDRARCDLIPPETFERLEAALKDSGWRDITTFGNKFIAHAADEHSRGSLLELEQQHGFSLDRLARCQKALCQVAAAIYGPILWEGSHGLIPIPQYNQFDQLDAAWVDRDDVERLGRFWNSHLEEVEQWNQLGFLDPSSGT